MPVMDFFRNFFGGNKEEPINDGSSDHRFNTNRFRNPIWQADDDDDDIDDFRNPTGGIQFRIFSDPFEMTRYFELQMDGMLKQFFHGLQGNSVPSLPDAGSIEAIEAPLTQDGCLRDQMIKSGYHGRNQYNGNEQKIDIDLDEEIKAGNINILWDNHDKPQTLEPVRPQQQIIGKSVRKQIFRRSDGTMEQKQIIRDNDGNEETIISRQIGDKKHVISTKRDKFGVETKTEDVINMDDKQLLEFSQMWAAPHNDSSKSRILDRFNGYTQLRKFSWEDFFGPNPKL